MRKKFATLLLAFMLIIPCALFFTACDSGEEKKVKSIAVELVSTKYTMTDNTINIPYTGGKIELTPSDFKVTATMEDDTTEVLPVKTATQDGYEFVSTLPDGEVTARGTYSIAFAHPDTLTRPTITVNVVKGDIDMNNVDWTYTTPFTYDGNEKIVLLDNLPAGVSVTYRTRRSTDLGEGKDGYGGTYAGTYVTTATFAHSDDYNDIAPKSLTWTIKPKQYDISHLSWSTVGPYAYTGIQILPILETDPTFPDSIIFTYFYTKDGVSVNPYEVGTYKVEVSARSENLNYEVVGSVAPLTYEIVPKELDCSKVSWGYESGKIYEFTGSAITPTLSGLPTVGCSVSYTYSDNLAGQNKLVDGKSVYVGSYKATATISTTSGNFRLVNCNVEEFEYSIKEMTIDVSTFNWNVGGTVEYDGNTQKPTMTIGSGYSRHISFNYHYLSESDDDKITYIPKESDLTSLSTNPINVGKYFIYAYPVLTNDSENYILKDGEEYISTFITKSFEIVEADLPTDQIGWNVTIIPNINSMANYDETNLELKDDEEFILKVDAPNDILNIFDITYMVNSIEQNGGATITNKNNFYDVVVTFTLKDSLRNNYTAMEYNMFLYVYIQTNPFASILVNGESVAFAEFINSTYEHGTSISLTTKDGYTMNAGDKDNVTTYSYIVDSTVDRDVNSQRVSVCGEYGEVYAVDFEPYVIESITVDGEEYDISNIRDIIINYTKDQTSLNIGIDNKYLTKYNGKLKYSVSWGDPIEITSSTISITEIDVEYGGNVKIFYETDEGTQIIIITIDVRAYSRVKSIFYNKIDIDETIDVRAESVYNQITLSSNEILLSLKAKVDDGYTYGFYCDENAKKKLDLTDINSLHGNSLYIIVFDSTGKIVEKQQISIDYNLCDTATQVTIVDTESIQTSNSEFGITIEPKNSAITVSSKFDGNDKIILSDGANTTDYELKITYKGVTYTYTKKINVVKTPPLSDYLKEDGEEESFSGTIAGEPIENGYINGNNLNIYLYDVSQFDDIDLESITIGNIKDGYSVKKIEKVVANGKLYLKVSLEESSTENIIVIYLYVMISGDYDDDIAFTAYDSYSNKEISVVEEGGVKVIKLDLNSQSLKIELSNPYATITICDENGDSINIYNYDYIMINEEGNYTLTVTSTDGTKSEIYTIIATREDDNPSVPPTEPDVDIPETIKIGSTTYSTSEIDQYYKLGKDQVEIVVKVDEEWLSGDVSLYYGFDDGTVYPINSTSTTINVYNYTYMGAMMYIGYMNEYDEFVRLSEGIEIIVWSEVKQINYTILDLTAGTTSTESEVFRGFNQDIKSNMEPRQKIITNVTVDFETGYTSYSYKVTEKDYTTTFDYTTINLDSHKRDYWIIMYDNNGKEIGRVGGVIQYGLQHDLVGDVAYSDFVAYDRMTKDEPYSITFDSPGHAITLPYESKIKKSGDSEYVNSVSLVDGINSFDWKMTVTFGSVTYTFTKSMIVFIEPIDWSIAFNICRDGALIYDGRSFTIYTDFDAGLIKSDGSQQLHNPNEIKELELDKFGLDIPTMENIEDIEVKGKEFVFIGGYKFIKFKIQYSLDSTSYTEYLYIRLSEYGTFDNNIEFRAEKDSINGTEYLDITSSTTQISMKCCTESLFVELDNEFAICVLTDSSGNTLYTYEGFLLDYRFKESGTYTLTIKATDGTTSRPITINVTGDYVADLKLVLETDGDSADLTLICDIESFDEMAMGSGSNFSFGSKGESLVLETYLGADHNLKITTEGEGDDAKRYVTLTEFASALVNDLHMIDGTKISTYPAKLEVLTDSNGDYIATYIEEQPGFALPVYIYLYDKAPALQMTIEGTTTDIELLCDIVDLESLETSDDSNVGIMFIDSEDISVIFYAYLGDLESSGVKVTTEDGIQYISVSSLKSGLMMFSKDWESELTAPCDLPIDIDEEGIVSVTFFGIIMEYMQIAQITLIFSDMPSIAE